jgi:hypothetical protein
MKNILLGIGATLVACAGSVPLSPPAAPLTSPTVLCQGGEARPCRSTAEVEAWLRHPELEILGAAGTPKGKQKARVLTLAVPGDRERIVFRAKWRADSTQHPLNDPRKELAAYVVQKLFLNAEQYVVPPAAGHCFPLAGYRTRVDATAQASFPRVECVFGILSYWLEDAQGIDDAADSERLDEDDLFDQRLFWKDPVYRRSLADVNLLAHVISHGDSHPAQFVITGDRYRPRVHVVDNTISFSDFRNPRLDREEDWSILHVPALSAESVARLRALRVADVRRLGVIERYEKRPGQLVHTDVPASGVPRDAGVRWVSGRLEVGLMPAELEELWRRIQGVLARVDSGEVRTF